MQKNSDIKSIASDELNLDEGLMRRIVAKDRAAFERLYNDYQPRLSGFLYRLTGRRELVEELVNEVMFTVWQKSADFKWQSRVSTWIFGIAYLKTLKALKKNQRHGGDTDLIELENQADERPETEFWHSMMRRRIATGLKKLSPEQRVVVELTYYHEFSYPEISEIMSVPVNTVKTRMFHARQRLRKLLSELEKDWLVE